MHRRLKKSGITILKLALLIVSVIPCGCVTLPSEIPPATEVSTDFSQVLSCEDIRKHQYAVSSMLAKLVEKQMKDRILIVEPTVRMTPIITGIIYVATFTLGPEATFGAPFFLLGEPIYAMLREKDLFVSDIALLKAVLIQLEELALKNGCS